ncbi:Tup N-terminal-domain-containing protein [Flagelloscypha sp. PMI_526]|nr:Tup N-terminal-domain-containing protein [Flagelloscypha sp. PMI_526]
MSSSVYNHRSLAPNPGMPRGAQEGLLRLNEAFDTIKSEYDLLLNEVGVVKSQRDEAESKMAAQVNELNIIRQTLYDLEGNHHKIRTQYEDELGRLRLELQQYKNMVTNKEDRASTNAPSAAPGPREPRYRGRRSLSLAPLSLLSMSKHFKITDPLLPLVVVPVHPVQALVPAQDEV